MPAARSVPAESPVVPGTVPHFGLRVDVQEGALLVVAGVEPGVEVALRHLAHVVLVEELAVVALLAESPQPVLADDGLVAADVSKRAARPAGTRGRHVELADGGARLVHARKGQRERARLIAQRHLHVERVVLNVRNEALHGERSKGRKEGGVDSKSNYLVDN